MKNAELGPIVNPPAYETIEAPTCTVTDEYLSCHCELFVCPEQTSCTLPDATILYNTV